EGSYAISVQIGDAGGSSISTGGTAQVADAALTHAAFKAFHPVEGRSFTGLVASFRDSDPNGRPSDYTATITWGDGQTSAGRITPTGTSGFDVTGTNTYARAGTFTIRIFISDAGGSNLQARTTATVTNSPAPTSASLRDSPFRYFLAQIQSAP